MEGDLATCISANDDAMLLESIGEDGVAELARKLEDWEAALIVESGATDG